MRKSLLKISLLAIGVGISLNSCTSDNTDILQTDPSNGGSATTTATIRLTEGGAADDIFFAEANGEAGSTIPGRVVFTTTSGTQRRLYVTQTLPGGTPEPFVIPTDPSVQRRLTKPDGSIDLDDENKDMFDFTFDLQVPNTMDNGKIIYNFWSTTGKGDFRNPSKRQLIGVGSIEVSIGTGINPNTQLSSFTGVRLYAPDSEGKTEAFFSLLDGKSYAPIVVVDGQEIAQGPELRNYWDFGYYYTSNAAFSSAKEYTSNFPFNVEGFTPTAEENSDNLEVLNATLFRKSTDFDLDQFDSASVAGDLDTITTPTSSNVTNLAVGDIIEFVDNYGNKGLIRVKFIEPGFDNNDFIEIDVKVQPNVPMTNN